MNKGREHGKGKCSDCHRKKRYASESQALDAAKSYRRKRSVKLRPYYSYRCDGWHLTRRDEYGATSYVSDTTIQETNTDLDDVDLEAPDGGVPAEDEHSLVPAVTDSGTGG